MHLEINEGIPPKEKEVYIVVVKRAFIYKNEVWSVMNEDFPIGYILEDSPCLSLIPKESKLLKK